MSTHANPAYPSHDFPRTWSALDLADAVPLRLSERITLGLVGFTAPVLAANSPFAAQPARKWHRHYLRSAELPAFVRVR
ncbi:hypothetical protein [Lysobacter solisilvae (ex Woo and Kim 2020)]|uniref:Uncharacterized protein n=1 Tax=Agrilutibacter terrestris TaxID=2865112 RepID=A0A7H0G015_9GAMM|nr:hypothetical protein [Lysobacter terrestris]QNP41631.1 hypothetical protein H8B22_05335 [Lysobacter terrestris]